MTCLYGYPKSCTSTEYNCRGHLETYNGYPRISGLFWQNLSKNMMPSLVEQIQDKLEGTLGSYKTEGRNIQN